MTRPPAEPQTQPQVPTPTRDGALELVLLRHGQTDWNREHRIQGQSQSQLDELGRAQAEAVAPVLAALRPAALWCSDADRARSTAEPLLRATGLEPTYDARLREYSFGHWEGLYHADMQARDPAAYADFRRADWEAVPGVEAQAAVAARTTAALSELADQVGEGVALAVSHGAAIRTATVALLGWPPATVLDLRGLSNCGWVVLRREAVGEPWRLVTYNRVVSPGRVPDDAV